MLFYSLCLQTKYYSDELSSLYTLFALYTVTNTYTCCLLYLLKNVKSLKPLTINYQLILVI